MVIVCVSNLVVLGCVDQGSNCPCRVTSNGKHRNNISRVIGPTFIIISNSGFIKHL